MVLTVSSSELYICRFSIKSKVTEDGYCFTNSRVDILACYITFIISVL